MALDRDELNNNWTPKCELCDWTGEPDAEQGKAQAQYLSHCKTPEHKENKKNKQEAKAASDQEVQPPPGDEKPEPVKPDKPVVSTEKAPEAKVERKPAMSDLSETECITFYGDEGKRFLKRKKLEQLLGMAPDMTDKIIRWVMENYDQDENAKRDLNALYMLLLNCKVKQEYAGRIVQMIMAMEQKWWNDQNNQANAGMYFSAGPQGQPMQQQFFDWQGRPVPQNFNQPYFNNPDPRMNQGYPHNYYPPQRQPDPQIEEIKKTVEGLAKSVALLANPPKAETKPINIEEAITAAVAKATEKPPLTKEDILDVVQNVKKKEDEENHLSAIVFELKAMRGDIDRLDKRKTPMPNDISEAGSIEVAKLDLIGGKLDNIHDTVKKGMELLLAPEEKPLRRSGDDITRIDSELDRMAASPGGG